MSKHKRFTIADYPTDIIDNQNGKEYACSSYGAHMEILCDLLNKLSEENEQLKKEKQELIDIIDEIDDGDYDIPIR